MANKWSPGCGCCGDNCWNCTGVRPTSVIIEGGNDIAAALAGTYVVAGDTVDNDEVLHHPYTVAIDGLTGLCDSLWQLKSSVVIEEHSVWIPAYIPGSVHYSAFLADFFGWGSTGLAGIPASSAFSANAFTGDTYVRANVQNVSFGDPASGNRVIVTVQKFYAGLVTLSGGSASFFTKIRRELYTKDFAACSELVDGEHTLTLTSGFVTGTGGEGSPLIDPTTSLPAEMNPPSSADLISTPQHVVKVRFDGL